MDKSDSITHHGNPQAIVSSGEEDRERAWKFFAALITAAFVLCTQSLPAASAGERAVQALPGEPADFDLSLQSSISTSPLVRAALVKGAGKPVPRELFGVNTLYFHDTDSVRQDSRYLASMRQLQPAVIRYPAGTAGDNYFWKTNSPYRSDWYWGESHPDEDMDTTELLRLAADIGAKPIMVINYRSFADKGDMEACYSNAEEWVRFVNFVKKADVRYWEFGNEVYFQEHGVNPEHYAGSYDTLRTRLRKLDPKLRLGLTMTNSWSDARGVVERFNSRVLEKLRESPDFIILHFYPSPNEDAFARTGMSIRWRIRSFREELGRRGFRPDLPVFVTEWNVSGKGKEVPAQSMAHMLAIAQGLLEMNDVDVQCATFWPLHLSKGLIDSSRELRPAGRVHQWMRNVMCGIARVPLRIEQNPGWIDAAAFQHPGGETRILVLNRSPTQETGFELTLLKNANVKAAALTTLSPPRPERDGNSGAKILRNEQALKPENRRLAFRLPPFSISVLRLETTR